MLEKLGDVPDGIVGVKAIGRVTRKDYESVLDPLILGASREGRRLRFLYEVGPECEGFTPGAAWEDAKLGIHALGVFAACAVVTDHEWIRQATRVAAFLLPCPVHAFPVCDRAKAIAWLGSVPHEVGVAHRLIPDKGVLVIDAKRPLHTQDFDVLALTVDPWIEAHGGLEGIVIHAPMHFPYREEVSEASSGTCSSSATIGRRCDGSRSPPTGASPAWRRGSVTIS